MPAHSGARGAILKVAPPRAGTQGGAWSAPRPPASPGCRAMSRRGWSAAGEEVTEDEENSSLGARRPCTGEADAELGRERMDVQNLEEAGLTCE